MKGLSDGGGIGGCAPAEHRRQAEEEIGRVSQPRGERSGSTWQQGGNKEVSRVGGGRGRIGSKKAGMFGVPQGNSLNVIKHGGPTRVDGLRGKGQRDGVSKRRGEKNSSQMGEMTKKTASQALRRDA